MVNEAQRRKTNNSQTNFECVCWYTAVGATSSSRIKTPISQSLISSTPYGVGCDKPKFGRKSNGKQNSHRYLMQAPEVYIGCTPEAVWQPAHRRIIRQFPAEIY